jgi:hypothetical protein
MFPKMSEQDAPPHKTRQRGFSTVMFACLETKEQENKTRQRGFSTVMFACLETKEQENKTLNVHWFFLLDAPAGLLYGYFHISTEVYQAYSDS